MSIVASHYEENTVSAMYRWIDEQSPIVDWNKYQGYELVTADRIRIGVVESVIFDRQSEDFSLLVAARSRSKRRIRVPVKYIGIITSSKLMLDVPRAEVHALELEQIDRDTPLQS